MPRFSERIGATTPIQALQVDSMSEALRNSLWNFLLGLYHRRALTHNLSVFYWARVAHYIARDFRKVPADELPDHDLQSRQWIKEYFFELSWSVAYDLIEFVADNHRRMVGGIGDSLNPSHPVSQSQLWSDVNAILERELSGFRFIQGVLTPITDLVEVQEIEEAVEASRLAGLDEAAEHIRTSVVLLGKRPEPDYRNAINGPDPLSWTPNPCGRRSP